MSTHRSKTGSGHLQQPEYLFIGYSHGYPIALLYDIYYAISLWIFLSTFNGSVSTQDLVRFNHKFMDLFQPVSNGSISIWYIWSISTTNTWICFNPFPMDLFQSDKDKIYIWICFNPLRQMDLFQSTKFHGSLSTWYIYSYNTFMGLFQPQQQ